MRLIDADALKEAFCDYCSSVDTDMEICRNCETMRIVDRQHTIESEPVRHGRWIFVGEETMHDGWTYRKYKCSECGYLTVEAIDFCQKCGVRMDATDTNNGKGGADND